MTCSSTEPVRAIALRAPSKGDVVRRSQPARSRAAFMSRPATWRERSPRLTLRSFRERKRIEMLCVHKKRILRLGRLRCEDLVEPSESSRWQQSQNLRRLSKLDGD